MRQLVPENTSFDFLGKAKFFVTFSLVLMVLSVVRWFMLGDEKYGTDFLGGNEFVVQFTEATSSDAIREALTAGGVESPTVQAFEATSNQFSIRTGATDDEKADAGRLLLEQSLKEHLKKDFTIIKADFVGPIVGAELRET